MSERACESCGHPDDELLLVRRVYILGTGDREVDDGPAELWCVSCVSQYPYEPAETSLSE